MVRPEPSRIGSHRRRSMGLRNCSRSGTGGIASSFWLIMFSRLAKDKVPMVPLRGTG